MADQPLILVIDDDGPILALMRNLLKEFGYRAVTAADGRNALAEVQKQSPALVLLDKNMPGMSAGEVIRELRSQPGLEAVPVLMLTGERISRSELASLGANGAVLKPFDVPDLLDQIRHHLPL